MTHDEWGLGVVSTLLALVTACRVALLAHLRTTGAGPGPSRENGHIPSRVLNPLLKTCKVNPAFSPAQLRKALRDPGSGPTIKPIRGPVFYIGSNLLDPQTHFTDEDTKGPNGPQSPGITQLGRNRASFEPSYKVLENTVLTSSLVAKFLMA